MLQGVHFVRCYAVSLLLSLAVAGGCGKKLQSRIEKTWWLETLWLTVLFLLCMAYVVGSTGRAALYAGF